MNDLLLGRFDKEYELSRLRQKGKKEEDVNEWNTLASEVIQAISSKQLKPTMRTQYMRTAFQIPFDATVRISLDTNLCMINERTSDTANGSRWYRDPSKGKQNYKKMHNCKYDESIKKNNKLKQPSL